MKRKCRRLQDDFRELQNTIQELIVSRGHHCIFLPKYHPELNFIERYWSRVKWYARQHSDGTVAGLKATASHEAGVRLLRPRNDSEVRADFLEVGRCLPLRVGRRARQLGCAPVQVPPVRD